MKFRGAAAFFVCLFLATAGFRPNQFFQLPVCVVQRSGINIHHGAGD